MRRHLSLIRYLTGQINQWKLDSLLYLINSPLNLTASISLLLHLKLWEEFLWPCLYESFPCLWPLRLWIRKLLSQVERFPSVKPWVPWRFDRTPKKSLSSCSLHSSSAQYLRVCGKGSFCTQCLSKLQPIHFSLYFPGPFYEGHSK